METETIEPNNSLSESGVDKRNTTVTVYLRLDHDLGTDESVRYRFFILDDGKIQSGPEINEEEVKDLIDSLIPSPPRASPDSTMVVVGEQLYLVGGRINPYDEEDYLRFDFPCVEHVYRINPAVEKEWEKCNSLNMPRSSAQLLVDSSNSNTTICAIGCLMENERGCLIDSSPDKPWAEIFDLERGEWSTLEITLAPNSKCKNLPWVVRWCVRIPNSTEVVFYAYDLDVHRKGDFMKLYKCDFSAKQCDYFDETFISDLRSIIGNGDLIKALEFSPAQQGYYLYFAGRYNIYCYCLETQKWCSNPMGGFDLRSTHLSSMPMDLQVVSLGNRNFGAIWIDLESKILSWAKFQIINPPHGFPMAIGFSAAAVKKFRHPLLSSIAGMRCFVIAHSEKRKASDPQKDSRVEKRSKPYNQKDVLSCINVSIG